MNNKYNVDELYEKMGLIPYDEFSTKQRAINLAHPESYRGECDGFRQTGRTTRQLCKAIANVLSGTDVVYYVSNQISANHHKKKAEEILNKIEIHNFTSPNNDICCFSKDGTSSLMGTKLSFVIEKSTKKVYFDAAFND